MNREYGLMIMLPILRVKGQQNMEESKQCSKCGEFKDLSKFGKNGNYYRGQCKECRANDIKEFRSWLNTFKEVPCKDCGKQFPAVLMDFDHIPEKGPKLKKVSSILSKEKALEELAKCEVVCAWCHRIRTVTRLGLLTQEDIHVISQL